MRLSKSFVPFIMMIIKYNADLILRGVSDIFDETRLCGAMPATHVSNVFKKRSVHLFSCWYVAASVPAELPGEAADRL